MRNRSRLGSTAAILAVMGAAWFGVLAFAQTAPKPAAKPTKPSEPAVAVVGGRRITRAAFEQRVREAEETYRQRSNTPIPASYRPTMRRQVLEGMIREQLLILEARRRGMGLTEAQAEEELKKDAYFQRGGVFDEAKFVTIKNTQPAEFRAAIATIQSQLPAVRLKEQIERENSASAAEVKAEIERELSQVTIDFLALRRSGFSAYSPEPSEREVLDYYRAHASEFPRPEQVVLTILTVQEPPLDPSQAGVSGALQKWEAGMKERADSLLAGLKKGGRLEDLAPRFGELSKGVEASRDRMPTMWRGTSRVQQSLFSTQVGNHLNEAVPGTHGFLLVRVDQKRPPHTASLKEVAVLIRDRLRAQALARKDQEELDQIYASIKDALRGPAYKIRYAVADTSVFPIKEPTSAEIDRYYRGHLADYSYFDAKTSSVSSKPLSEVRDDVRRRLVRERRAGAARTAADQLMAAWKAGKRDSKLERAMTMMRDVGPIPVGGVVDTGAAGAALTDSLESRPGLGIATIRSRRGPVVYHAYSEIKDYTPTRAEARPILEARREPMRKQQEEAGGRQLFEQNPGRFRASNVVRFSRLMVNLPEALNVPLTREEVDRHYRSHITEYGAPELIRVRHILLAPKDASAAADAEARRRADDVMRRLKSGESFADLAKKFSDDEGSRDKGGELGVYGHGMMLEDFEHETFSMRPGDLKGPVKTQIGYHVIECLEHAPAETTPLRYAYSTVAADAALEKADRIGRMRADSLRRAIKSPYHAHRAARAMSYTIYQNDHVIGSPAGAEYLEDYFRRVEKLKPRQFDDRVQEYRGMGYAVTWADSILSQSKPRWEDVRDQATDLYRRERDYAILLRKRAELDSLLRAGWTFDSLSTLYGGFETHGPRGPGSGLERLAGRELLDSLAFGTNKTPPVLQVGKPTGWVEFPAGPVMMKLTERRTGDPVQMASRIESETRGRLEVKLRKVYDKMSDRYKVEILDPDLKLIELPQMPGS